MLTMPMTKPALIEHWKPLKIGSADLKQGLLKGVSLKNFKNGQVFTCLWK